MDNVLIDDRRIHVDFSQSVAKLVYNKPGEYHGEEGGCIPPGIPHKRISQNDENPWNFLIQDCLF